MKIIRKNKIKRIFNFGEQENDLIIKLNKFRQQGNTGAFSVSYLVNLFGLNKGEKGEDGIKGEDGKCLNNFK